MAKRVRRPRLRGVALKPGAVRTARLEAGLSLAELGAGHVTRSAIHQIETGRVKPSRPTLNLIARRTGKPVEYFLVAVPGPRPAHLQAQIDELERLVLAEDFQAARSLGRDVAAAVGSERDEAPVRFWTGQAESRVSQSPEGLLNLRRARELYERLGDELMVVECLDWEAASLYSVESGAALPIAREALARLRPLAGAPTRLRVRVLTHLAAIHVSRHEWEPAAEAYGEARALSASFADLKLTARLDDCLAQVHIESGHLGPALSSATRALTVHQAMGDEGSLARTENNLGLIFLRRGDLARAEERLESSLERSRRLGLERGRAHVLLSLAEVAMAVGDRSRAAARTEEAIDLAGAMGEPATQALGHQLLGLLAADREDARAAVRHFEVALALLGALGAQQRLLECHYRYGEALHRLGRTDLAVAQMRLAVLSVRPDLAAASSRLTRPERSAAG
ncbi:MAG: helix-turn-helix domain-containing protein [Candidatus Dormibacterales bacterium]